MSESPAPQSGLPVGDLAIVWAQTRIGSSNWAGHCYAFVRGAFIRGAGLGDTMLPLAPDARSAAGWYRVHGQLRSGGTPPRGALVFYDNRTPRGHVAISLGGGAVIHAYPAVQVSSNYLKLPGRLAVTVVGYVTAQLEP